MKAGGLSLPLSFVGCRKGLLILKRLNNVRRSLKGFLNFEVYIKQPMPFQVNLTQYGLISKKRSWRMGEKGLSKPVKLKNDLAEVLGAMELPRTEITQKIWEYVRSKKLQTRTQNGKPENAGKFIVADEKLLPIFRNTKITSKAGRLTDLSGIQLGQTIDMMQMASVISANIEA